MKLGTVVMLNKIIKEEAPHKPDKLSKVKYKPVDLTNTELDDGQRKRLQALLMQFGDVIAQSEYDIGKTRIVKHTIPLVDETLITEYRLLNTVYTTGGS